MNTIIEDKEELFDVYREHFGYLPLEESKLRREFESILLRKIAYMPYWFVVELMVRGYDIIDQEEDF